MATCEQCGSEPETSGLPCSKCGAVLPPRKRHRIRVRKRRRVPILFYAEGAPNWTMIALAVIIAVLLAFWLLNHLNRIERVPKDLTGSAAAPFRQPFSGLDSRVISRTQFLGFRELGQTGAERI